MIPERWSRRKSPYTNAYLAAGLQPQLTIELRAYADDVAAFVGLVKSGAWKDEATFKRKADAFEAQSAKHAARISAIAKAFRARGYTISVQPH